MTKGSKQIQPQKQKSTKGNSKTSVTKDAEEKIIAMAESFSGPLPPPVILKQYEEIVPGAANIIIEMAQKQGEHRQWMEKQSLIRSNREVHIGQILGFVLCSLAILAGVYASVNGAPVSGGLIGTGGIVGLAAVFIYGSRKQTKDEAK